MAFGLSAASAAMVGSIAGPLVGGLMGGQGSSQSQSTQQTLDPRMEGAIYGDGGLLSGAKDWYSQNKTGLNNQMLTGMNNQWNQHGASQQGFNAMQGAGMGLMGRGVAGNPFTGQGGLSGFTPQMQPQQIYQPAQAQYQPAQQPGGGVNAFSMPTAPVASPMTTTAPAAPAQDPYIADWWANFNNNVGGSA